RPRSHRHLATHFERHALAQDARLAQRCDPLRRIPELAQDRVGVGADLRRRWWDRGAAAPEPRRDNRLWDVEPGDRLVCAAGRGLLVAGGLVEVEYRSDAGVVL